MPSKVWDDITYPFPNSNGAIVFILSWNIYWNVSVAVPNFAINDGTSQIKQMYALLVIFMVK